jgi:hypothetical protein
VSLSLLSQPERGDSADSTKTRYIESCRDQGFLLPPDVPDRLPADHLVWFVIDTAAQMDLNAFYGAYRVDGHGAAAH